MRRMKEMAAINAGMSFYGEMPDMYNMVLNTDSPQVRELLTSENEECVSQLIDLALLQNGMLSGEALSKFIRRSVDMIK